MPDEIDDVDVESFIHGLKVAILELSKKHSTPECFMAEVAVPLTMLHRTIKRWEGHRHKMNDICPLCGSKGIGISYEWIEANDKYSKPVKVFLCSLESCRNIFHGGTNGSG